MKRSIFLFMAVALLTLMCACGNQSGIASPTGNTSVTTDGGGATPDNSPALSASPFAPTDEMLGKAKKAIDNEWYSDITCSISEPAETEYGEKRLISVTFKNTTSDKEFISFGFVAMLFDAEGKPINAIVERFGDHIDLNPGEVFDRDEWIVPLESRQAKVCIKSIVYRESGEKTWENPYITDWITVEEDSF